MLFVLIMRVPSKSVGAFIFFLHLLESPLSSGDYVKAIRMNATLHGWFSDPKRGQIYLLSIAVRALLPGHSFCFCAFFNKLNNLI